MKLYVGNISYNTNEDDLRGLFAQAGTVISAVSIKDPTTGMSKGFAFVEMDSQVSAQKAISMFNEYMLNDRQLAVGLARPHEDRDREGFQKQIRGPKLGGKKHYIRISMTFKVGDRVIHPQHGLGQVTNLAVKEFVEGEKRPFYEISFSGSTLWVPLNLTTSGVRKLSTKTEIVSCRRVLKAPAEPLTDDFRLRQMELNNHLKEGTITARCEVVRDLAAYGWHKPLNGSITAFLQTTLEVLCQEWAAVEGIALSEASTEVQSLLEQGKQSNDNK